MRITSLTAAYPRYYGFAPGNWRRRLWQIVVRVESDTGDVGYGYGGGGDASVLIVNGHFRELLEGVRVDDIDDIGTLWDTLYHASIPYGRGGIAMMALSGVDLALWDLLGNATRKPVAELLGGIRKQSVDVYATGGDSEWYAELGVAGQKLTHRCKGEQRDYETAVEAAERARKVIGKDRLLMFDVYMSWDETVARRMSDLLAPHDVYWFEDVLTPDDYDRLARLRPEVAPVKLAGGEHELGVRGFDDVARSGAYDIWQPDITWCGGITAGVRIAELAARHGARVVPHRGGEVWGLHLIAARDECDDLAELVLGSREQRAALADIWSGQPQLEGGRLEISDAPGFGVQPSRDILYGKA